MRLLIFRRWRFSACSVVVVASTGHEKMNWSVAAALVGVAADEAVARVAGVDQDFTVVGSKEAAVARAAASQNGEAHCHVSSFSEMGGCASSVFEDNLKIFASINWLHILLLEPIQ